MVIQVYWIWEGRGKEKGKLLVKRWKVRELVKV